MALRKPHTLQEALGRLPSHEPPAALWPAIAQALEQQAADTVLREALQALPQHKPPPAVWQEINWRQALAQLPQHEPPASVWANIAGSLEQPQRATGRLIKLGWLARAAAAVLLAASIWWAWPSSGEAAAISYAASSEAADEAIDKPIDWNADSEVMEEAVALFRKDPLAKTLPVYTDWLSAWEELAGAQQEVTEMMQRYGRDARLLRQLGKIERERSALLRQMIAKI